MLPIAIDQIEAAYKSIQPKIRPTPVTKCLMPEGDKQVWLKAENLQVTGSFKIRGATWCIENQLDVAKKCGVVAASAGNHAQAVAAVSQRLGVQATIVMPKMTPTVKVQNTARWGPKIIMEGEDLNAAFDYAKNLAQDKGSLFVHAFFDPYIIAGQGTLALELLKEPDFSKFEAVVIPVGGGGLASGCTSVLKAKAPHLKIYGVAAKNAPATWHAYHHGKIGEYPVQYTMAEGVAFKKPVPEMMTFLKENLDDYFVLSEESIAESVALLAEHEKLVVEGAGALPLAAIREGLIPEKNVLAILSGGNIDASKLSGVLQRGLVEQGRLARVRITIGDRPGALNRITRVFKEHLGNIMHVSHTRSTLRIGVGDTQIEVEFESRGQDHAEEIIQALEEQSMQVDRVF